MCRTASETSSAARSRWKSSCSGGGDGSNCLEIVARPTRVSVRGSKGPAVGVLAFSVGSFVGFVAALEAGAPRR
nr:DUF397 domain-containing protein [Streptomyces humi]